MAYSDKVKEFCRQLYNDGFTYPQIAKRASKAFRMKISWKRIAAWGRNERYDWKGKREQLKQKRQEDSEKAQMVGLSRRLGQLDELIDSQVEDAKNQEPGNKRTQIIYGMNSLVKTRNELAPYREDASNVEEIIQRLFRVMLGHPQVAPVLKRYRAEIIESLRKDMEKN